MPLTLWSRGGAQQYISKSASGPGTTPGAVDPTTDTIEAVWTPYPKFASDADVLDESIDDEAVSPAGLDHFRNNADATDSDKGFVQFWHCYDSGHEYGSGSDLRCSRCPELQLRYQVRT